MAGEAVKIPFIEAAAPSTPAAGQVVTYAKADGLMYSKDDAGTETLMSGGSGSGIPATIFDAAGDIIVASAADTAARLATANSSILSTNGSGAVAWSAKPAFGSAVVTSAFNTTSTSFVDVTGVTATLTTLARRIKVTWQGVLGNTAADDWIDLTLDVDGADIYSQGLLEVGTLAANSETPFCIVYISAALTAASHTVKGRIRRAAGSGTVTVVANANLPSLFYVEELLF